MANESSIRLLKLPILILVIMLPAIIIHAGQTYAQQEDLIKKINLLEEPIQPLEKFEGLDPHTVKLGKKLFNDVRLSKDDTLSCATCHDLKQGGTVNHKYSMPGVSKKTIPINVPTIFGSVNNFAQFWDGRANNLEDQMDGPITSPDEMDSSWPFIINRLNSLPEYTAIFKDIYNSPATEQNIKQALTAYERSLIPLNSPFDRYLRGDTLAIDKKAREGYQLFKDLGCVSCHQGRNVGGNMFQKFGIIKDYFKDRGNTVEKDYGRYNVTKDENDRYVFKVPSLRNIALTAPYFHDGSAENLEQAVNIMATYQLGRALTKDEREKLLAFLNSLTGNLDADIDE